MLPATSSSPSPKAVRAHAACKPSNPKPATVAPATPPHSCYGWWEHWFPTHGLQPPKTELQCETQPHAAPTRHSPHGLHMRHRRPFYLPVAAQWTSHRFHASCSVAGGIHRSADLRQNSTRSAKHALPLCETDSWCQWKLSLDAVQISQYLPSL